MAGTCALSSRLSAINEYDYDDSVMMRYSLMVWVGVCWIRELVAQRGEGVCLARAD